MKTRIAYPSRFGKLVFCFLFLSAFLLQKVQASDFMEVVPITNKILMVFIKDGHIDSYGSNQTISDNVTYVNATNLTNAMALGNYVVTSSNDGNYSSAKNPINIGRKSKAVDYNDEWQSVPYVWGHWIYIELPNALVQGKTYTVQLNNIVENKNAITFVYDVNKLRSEAVHVNMVGFPQNGPKYAYISQWMGDFNTATHAKGGLELDATHSGAQFRLIKVSDGSTAFTGTIAKRMDKSIQETGSGDFGDEKNYSHADVWQCDFSTFTTSGEYVVAVDGIGCSYPFEISNDATREPYYYAMKGLFWQRQGIVKEIEPGKFMPRDHHPNDVTWKWDKNWAGSEDNSGFNTSSPRVYGIYGYYHDAGDWDGYVHHAKVPMSLLLLYDLAPDKFKDGEISNKYKLAEADANWINEGTNGIPDLLDEASWLIQYYKRARTTLQANYGGTGGVPGYVGRDAIPGNNITAWQDTREWYLSAENIEQTFLYAGLAAWYANCLNQFYQLTNSGNHPDFNSWVNDATAAWNWANGKGATTDSEKRAKGFAAAAMYRATANTTYQTAFQDYYNWEPSKGDGEWSNPNLIDMAMSIYSLIPSGFSGLNTTFQTTCKNEIQSKANNTKVDNSNANAFRCGIEYYQFFQLGSLNSPKMTILPVAYKLSGDAKYLDALKNAASYSLGGNQLNMTYLSGLSEKSDQWVFNPNGWLVNNYNSKVYSNEPLIGYTTYFGATGYWFYTSAYSEYFSRTASYPLCKDWPNTWPESESKFYNRYSIQGGEFTIHQQNNYMIYTMGYIKAMSGASTGAYTANTRPTLSLNLTEGQNFAANGCDLSVSASNDTRVVKYYYEWHYIGESTDKANNFKLFWDPIQSSGSVLITAVGYDDKGVMTLPTDAGDKNVTISTSATCGTPVTYTLNISASNGSVTKNPNKTAYNSGEQVALTPVANSGYVFSSWSGDASGSTNPLTVTMNANKNITANFTPTSTNRDPENPANTVSGLDYKYYEGTWDLLPNFSSITVAEAGNVASFDLSVRNVNDYFGFEFIGYIDIPTEGNYTFYTTSDDGSKLYIGTTQVVNNDGLHGMQEASGTIGLKSGKHAFKVTFFEKGGGEGLEVRYAGPGISKQLVPNSALYRVSSATNQKPTISISAPTANQSFNDGGNVDINISVNASDPDGSVKRVDYWYHTATTSWNHIGTSTTSPFGITWWNVPADNYTIEARATDNNDLASTDATVNITVVNGTSSCTATGTILCEKWDGISGTTIANLTGNVNYPNSPSSSSQLSSFEIPTNVADNYGVRVRGYICTPSTGSYTFWIAGDDAVELWLSTNDDPANKTKIAYHNAWTNSKEWNKYTTQKSVAISLNAGGKYYIEALMKEGNGGDNLAVGWAKPGQATTTPSEVIPGSVLSPVVVTSVPSNLTHQWKFNNSGADEIGTNTATLVNTAAYSSTVKEGSASLGLNASSSNGYANVGSINLTNTFTISSWAYNEGTRAHQNFLMANSSDSESNAGFVLWVNDWNSTNGKIVLKHDDGASDAQLTTATGAFPMNQWNLVTLTVDNNTHIAKIYVNGIEKASGTIKTIGVNHELWIGMMWNQVWNGWGGFVDDVRTFNTVMSATDVLNLYNSTKSAYIATNEIANCRVYPNPASDFLNLVLDQNVQGQIEVLDLSGRLLHVESFDSESIVLNISELGQGVYLLKLSSSEVNRTIKFIKK